MKSVIAFLKDSILCICVSAYMCVSVQRRQKMLLNPPELVKGDIEPPDVDVGN